MSISPTYRNCSCSREGWTRWNEFSVDLVNRKRGPKDDSAGEIQSTDAASCVTSRRVEPKGNSVLRGKYFSLKPWARRPFSWTTRAHLISGWAYETPDMTAIPPHLPVRADRPSFRLPTHDVRWTTAFIRVTEFQALPIESACPRQRGRDREQGPRPFRPRLGRLPTRVFPSEVFLTSQLWTLAVVPSSSLYPKSRSSEAVT